MASLIFSHSKAIVNKAKKAASAYAMMCEEQGGNYREAYDMMYHTELRTAYAQFDEYLRVSKELHDRYKDFIQPTKQAYFITIRPDCSKCNLLEFMCKVEEYLKRKCFLAYTLSYEQKGTSDDTIGQGFHCHIVADMKQRSKTEVIRDTISSWKKWIDEGKIASNCIQVDVTKNPDELVQNYLIEYKSDDDHKVATKEWDDKWRSNIGIPYIITKHD